LRKVPTSNPEPNQMNRNIQALRNLRPGLIFALILTISIGLNSCRKNNSLEDESRIDSLFHFYSDNKPGGQLAVSRNGRVIYSKAWGTADLESNTPLTTTTLIEAGSVSKQFTAAAILLLEQQGKLRLSDPAAKYIPELPGYGQHVLIRHLVHHTSGLREWSDIAEFAGSPLALNVPDNQAVLDIICRQRSLNRMPGEEFRYSNSNYILLALIVEKASGMSFADFTKKYIFDPAGMIHTQWRTDPAKVVPKLSQAYEFKNGAFRTLMLGNGIHGPGGLVTTAEDLLKWNEFYTSGRFGGKGLFHKQIAPDTLNNGDPNNYAAGLFVENNVPKPSFHHGGATAGYRAKLICAPSQGLSVAWLSNTSMLDTIGVNPATEVFKMLAKAADNSPRARKPATGFKPDHENLKSYAGLYKSGQSGRDVDITLTPKGLMLSETLLDPVDEHRFRFYDMSLTFDRQGGLTVVPPSAEAMRYHLVDATATAEPADQYIGTYFSDEVGAPIKVLKKGNELELILVSGARHPLQTHFKGGFLVQDIQADLVFQRNNKGGIEAFEISTARSLRIRFGKAGQGKSPQLK
jgi:CubicO group peptidase (beta-lactamase class C family)